MGDHIVIGVIVAKMINRKVMDITGKALEKIMIFVSCIATLKGFATVATITRTK